MRNKSFFTIAGFSLLLLLQGCGDTKSNNEQTQKAPAVSLAAIVKEIKLDMDRLSYAYGVRMRKQCANYLGNRVNEDQYVADFMTAKATKGLDYKKLQQEVYGIRNTRQYDDATVREMNSKVAQFLAVGEEGNVMMSQFNAGQFGLGFKDQGMGTSAYQGNIDSLYLAELKMFNEQLGKKYLEENKKRPGVTTTASGLQYEVLVPGKGEKPVAASKVTVHYTGTMLNSVVFDSSVERGKTISFSLGNVIKGWTEGLQLMSPGAKYRFYIPYELAYGASSQGKILPMSTLIFDVELFSFE